MRMSIIIPVYNAEEMLARCLSSILDQTFDDYQVIIVDDESTDNSLQIIQNFAEHDSRFIVISIRHGGSGAARNAGLSHATGDYILYMDADDYWIQNDLLMELEKRIQLMPADIYMYQMLKVTEDGSVLERYTKPPFEKSDIVQPLESVYQDLVKDGYTLAAVWNKCVKREVLLNHKICFREDVLAEDIDWVLQLFSHVRTICLLNIQAYAYTQHKTISRSTRTDAPNDLVQIIRDWAGKLETEKVFQAEAVAGVLAFEYGICMGNHHLLSEYSKRYMKNNTHLLDCGLDKKTLLIRNFYHLFGYYLTCAAVRLYLILRRIW